MAMEVKELPLEFGISKSFRINPIDPDDYLKKLMTKNISGFDGFRLDKNSCLMVINYSNGNKELIHMTLDKYRKYFRVLNKKVNKRFI